MKWKRLIRYILLESVFIFISSVLTFLAISGAWIALGKPFLTINYNKVDAKIREVYDPLASLISDSTVYVIPNSYAEFFRVNDIRFKVDTVSDQSFGEVVRLLNKWCGESLFKKYGKPYYLLGYLVFLHAELPQKDKIQRRRVQRFSMCGENNVEIGSYDLEKILELWNEDRIKYYLNKGFILTALSVLINFFYTFVVTFIRKVAK